MAMWPVKSATHGLGPNAMYKGLECSNVWPRAQRYAQKVLELALKAFSSFFGRAGRENKFDTEISLNPSCSDIKDEQAMQEYKC